VTAPASSGGPNVKAFSGADGSLLMSFYAYSPTFTGGVSLAVGDVNRDGHADIVTGSADGASHVEVFDRQDGTQLESFYAFGPLPSGGVRVATTDLNGDGKADLLFASGRGSTQVQGRSSDGQSVLTSFFAFPVGFQGGVNIG